ncbi:phage N-6-adenine-methyltransferase [bacterium]|nr:phage N-6-adenine-methyltransferase [bacterium]
MTDAPNPTTRTLGRDDWMTPPEVFDPVNAMVRFDLDACATNLDVARLDPFIDPRTDSLRVPWSNYGKRVWCNPPYGRGIKHWFKKAHEQADSLESRVMLAYANTDTQYWYNHVVCCLNVWLVVFLKPRVKFILPGDGDRKREGAPKGSALIFYHPALRSRQLRHRYWDYEKDSLKDAIGEKEARWASL